MANPRPGDDIGDTGVQPGRGAATGTPRWVKVFAIIAVLLVVALLAMMLVGGGNHGPGRHSSSDASRTPTAALIADDAAVGGQIVPEHRR